MRYTKGCFSPTFITTIGIDFVMKRTLVHGKWYRAVWWDTAGQERFRSISASYIKGAQGILLVFDVMDKASFASLKTWLQDVHSASDASVVVVANKCDFAEEEWAVSRQEAEAWALAKKLLLHFVSARTGTGVDTAFESLVALVASLPPTTATVSLVEKKSDCKCA